MKAQQRSFVQACCYIVALMVSMMLPGATWGETPQSPPEPINLRSGPVLQSQTSYGAWGESTTTGITQSKHCFGGHLCDAETGLIYMRGRYYDPQIGRFISADPVEGLINKPITWNPYLYANANPLYYTDPDGRFAVPLVLGAIALVDYLTSDKREQAQAEISPETYAGFFGAEAYAFSQAMANTLTVGYFDSVKAKGAAGYVDHTKAITGAASFEAAGTEIFAEDSDAILAGLHALQGSSQAILTIGNAGIGRSMNYRSPSPTQLSPNVAQPTPATPRGTDVAMITEGSSLQTSIKPMYPSPQAELDAIISKPPSINSASTYIEPQPVNTIQQRTFTNRYPEDVPGNVKAISPERLSSINGEFIYTVKTDGTFSVAKNNSTQGHIDLSRGAPVIAAGEVRIVAGEIKYIDNRSGHYRPEGASAQQAAENAFRNLGFSVDGKYIERPFQK